MSSILKYTQLAGDQEVGVARSGGAAPSKGRQGGRENPAPTESSCEKESNAAWQAGWQAGREEGLRSAQAEAARLSQEAEVAARQAEEARTAWWQAAEAEMVDLAIEIARRILRRELYLEPEAVVRLAKELLNESGARSRVELRVNPADLGLVEGERPALEAALGGGIELEIRGDKEIGAGGVIVESEAGGLDGRLETQLERLETALKEVAAGADA